ncbi:hypothetical protein BHE74_00049353 [Ensete ventricosum]|nr:hypothetical protein BHE74_00049353 [Ensete ventricosum]
MQVCAPFLFNSPPPSCEVSHGEGGLPFRNKTTRFATPSTIDRSRAEHRFVPTWGPTDPANQQRRGRYSGSTNLDLPLRSPL